MKIQVLANEKAKVEGWLKDGLCPNIRDEAGDTPLTNALQEIIKGRVDLLDMACILLRWGGESGNIDLLNSSLRYAASQGHSEAVGLLLQVPDINMNDTDDNGQTALMLAAISGHADVVNEIFKYLSRKLIDAAARGPDSDVVRSLRFIDTVVQTHGNDGLKAKNHATAQGHSSIVESLKKAKAIVIGMPDATGKTALMHAAAGGNHYVVISLLAEYRAELEKYGAEIVSVNAVDDNNQTALMHAVLKGHGTAAQQLLLYPNIDVKAQDKAKNTAFDLFPFNEAADADILKLFLQKKAPTARKYSNATARIPEGIMTTALFSLACQRDTDAIAHAVKLEYKLDDALRSAVVANVGEGADPVEVLLTQEPAAGARVLIHAATHNERALLHTWLTVEGVGVNNAGGDGQAARQAALQDTLKSAFDLFKFNSTEGSDHRTLDVAILELFLQKKANTTVRNYSNVQTRIPAAIMAKALINLALKPDNGGVEAIEHAISLGYSLDAALELDISGATGASAMLCEQDAELCARVFIAAAKSGDGTVVSGLIGAAVLTLDNKHEALTWAARNRCVPIVKSLLNVADIDVNYQNSFGNSALILAASFGHRLMVEKLLAVQGINIHARNNPTVVESDNAFVKFMKNTYSYIKGLFRPAEEEVAIIGMNTALVSASIRGNAEVVRLLLLAEGEASSPRDENNRTALMHACANGYIGVVKLLLAHSMADLNAIDKDGKTALMYAAAGGHTGVVKLLIDKPSIDVNIRDNCGDTALLYATQKNAIDVILMLLRLQKTEVNHLGREQKAAFNLFRYDAHSEKDSQEVVELFFEKGAYAISSVKVLALEGPKDWYNNKVLIPAAVMTGALANLAKSSPLAIRHALRFGYNMSQALVISVTNRCIQGVKIFLVENFKLCLKTLKSFVADKLSASVEMLLEADVGGLFKPYKTDLLIEAATAGDKATTQSLLKYSADSNEVNYRNHTALSAAVVNNKVGVVACLAFNIIEKNPDNAKTIFE